MDFPTIGEADAGTTAWMLTSAALVLLMTPGLAFFYGGMVRAKGVLNMMMMSFSAMGLVGVLWVLYGYSMAFGNDVNNLVGDPTQYFALKGLIGGTYLASDAVEASDGVEAADAVLANIPLVGSMPATVFVAFQAMFAIITVALISGAVADRMRFGPWLLFSGLWATLVYFPVAHWVFSFDGVTAETGGWIANKLAAVDFAGGTAVHINAGVAALVLVIVLGKRRGWPKEPMRPHNLPFVMLGAGLLWFGWFGFNAGSAIAADGVAGLAFINTVIATCVAMLAWLLTERIRDGHATSLGGASGIVAGLVAITPACAAVDVVGALAIGIVAGVLCALAVGLKTKLGYDDALDVVGVHLVGGLVGTLMIGLVGSENSYNAVVGVLRGGELEALTDQAIGAGAVLVYSGVVTAIIALALKYTIGLRLDDESEAMGIDESEHAETAYDFATLGSLGRSNAGIAGKSPAHAGKEG